jgi:outer membrane biosynthesis protein TonB
MKWMIAGAAIFFFISFLAWAFSLYSKQAIAARRKPDTLWARRRNLKGKPTQKPSQPRKGKLPSGYTPVQPIYPPASTPPEPPQSPPPPQPAVADQATPPEPPAPRPPQQPPKPEEKPHPPTPSPQPAKLTPWQLAGTNYRKILTFVDERTADRLLKSASYKYPEKSEAWLVDKVLWDLQRDKFRG